MSTVFERFSRQAREVVVGAQERARTLGHHTIGTEHLLLGALAHAEEPGPRALHRLGVTAQGCAEAVHEIAAERDGLGSQDAAALRELGIDLAEVRRRTEETFGSGALDAPGQKTERERRWPRGRLTEKLGHLPFTARGKKALELALREAARGHERDIAVGHVLLGVLRCEDAHTTGLLDRLGLDRRRAHALVREDMRAKAA